MALIALDGVARRLVVCPPGVPEQHLETIIQTAAIDAVVSDSDTPRPATASVPVHVTCSAAVRNGTVVADQYRTEWVLLTSGTSGRPKMICHDLSSLTAAIRNSPTKPNEVIWGTFY
ncbi:MAG: long-chain fatty acid--CoA ligase, partial [Xanthobacteraceae bacterium]